MPRLASCRTLILTLLLVLAACSETVPTEPIENSYAPAQFALVGLDPGAFNWIGVFGGTGGSQYVDVCPAGTVATGTAGTAARYNNTPAIYNLRLRCRTLNANGTFGASVVEVGGRGLGLGISATQPFAADCPSGSMLVAASGRADGIIREYGVECRSFEGVRTALGPWSMEAISPSVGTYAGACAPGMAITGLLSQAGYVLDGMMFRCTAITGLLPTATFTAPATVPEGTSFTLTLSGADAAGAVSALTYAFDCGSGYGAPASATSAGCPTSDDASYTARGRVATVDGLGTQYTQSVTIVNVAPVVAPLPNDSLLAGETYTHAGSFSDPGADSWAAVIDLGPTPSVPLAITGKTFTLARTYSTAGTFTLTVRVTDDDGGVGTASATVVVLTPSQGAQALSGKLSTLVAQGAVPPKTAEAMKPSLDAAAKHLEAGRPIPAKNELNAFKNKVTAAEKSKKITESVSGSLKKSADRIIASSSM